MILYNICHLLLLNFLSLKFTLTIHIGRYKLALQYLQNVIRLIKTSFSFKITLLPPTHVSSQSPASAIDVSKSHR